MFIISNPYAQENDLSLEVTPFEQGLRGHNSSLLFTSFDPILSDEVYFCNTANK